MNSIKQAIATILIALASNMSLAGAINPAGVQIGDVASIEVNGVSYAPGSTVTLSSPEITWKTFVPTTTFQKLTSAPNETGMAVGQYANLCMVASECLLNGSGLLTGRNSPFPSNVVTTTVSSGEYKIFLSSKANDFLMSPGHEQWINIEAPGITFVITKPASYTATLPTTPRSAFSLSAKIQPASTDVGQVGNLYAVVQLSDDSLFVLNNGTWQLYESGDIPAAVSNITFSAEGHVIDPFGSAPIDISDPVFDNAKIYLGYGSDSNDLLCNQKYGIAYAVR